MTTTQNPTSAEVAGRDGDVLTVLHEWADLLSEPSAHSNLHSYSDLKVGTLDLAAADPASRVALLDGQRVRLSRLFPYDPLATTTARSVLAIERAAREIYEEHGFTTCYLAMGLISWSDPYASRRPTVPVLLRPVTIVPADGGHADMILQVSSAVLVNPVLPEVMADRLGIQFLASDLVDPSGRLYYPTVVQRIRDLAPAHLVDSLSMDHRAVIGLFTPVRSLAAQDLRDAARLAREHRFLPALADVWCGQPVPRPTVDPRAEKPTPQLALPVDSAQRSAIEAVSAGGSHAIVAPPGSGATQTITNIVVDSLGRGERVLLVAGTASETADVLDRLDGLGLRHLALSLPDGGDVRADVAAQLRAAIQPLQSGSPNDSATPTADPSTAGQALDEHVFAVHRSREPWGVSAYEAWLAADRAAERSGIAVVLSNDLVFLGPESVAQLGRGLAEYVELGGLDPVPVATAWDSAATVDVHEAAALVGDLERLSGELLPATRDLVVRAAAEAGHPAPTSVAEAEELMSLFAAVSETLAFFGPGIWEEPLAELAVATGDRRYRAQHELPVGPMQRRRLRAQIRVLVNDEAMAHDHRAVHAALVRAQDALSQWLAGCHDGRLPREGEHAQPAQRVLADVAATLRRLAEVNPQANLVDLPFDTVESELGRLLGDKERFLAMPRLRDLNTKLHSMGLTPLLDELQSAFAQNGVDDRSTRAGHAVAALERSLAASVAAAVQAQDPALADFDPDRHEAFLAEFQAGERATCQDVAANVRRVHVERLRTALAGVSVDPRKSAELTHVRDLVLRDAPTMLSALPLWVCGPGSVPRVLPAEEFFDLVVVADAGRSSLVEAAPALLRAARVVAVGDGHLLPPTSPPLARLGVERVLDPVDLSATETTPSVLDAVSSVFPVHRLNDQHRCVDHRLMPLADAVDPQHHLLSPARTSPLDLVHVTQEGGRGQEDSVDAEVDRVADLVLHHARTRPTESLAVVALTRLHAERVAEAVRTHLRREAELSAFFDPAREEPFRVVEAAACHGLVRDAIVLTVGFGRTFDGRVLYQFGSLGRRYGAHLINLAASRARRRMTVVTALRADDLDPRRLSADGARLLRGLLVMAERGGEGVLEARPDALELAVAAALRNEGLPVQLGVGVGSGRIPLAVQHPQRSDRFVLAILTDGPTYRDAPSRSQRDRLIEAELRLRGWSTHRLWAPEWFSDRTRALQRVRDSLQEAIAWADAIDAAASAPAETQDEQPPEARETASRGERPALRYSSPLPTEMDPIELAEQARWIESDGASRSEGDVMAELVSLLGIDQSVGRGRDAIRRAVRAARSVNEVGSSG